jgi:CubicO group peptidase (beta-lactamase class C family)
MGMAAGLSRPRLSGSHGAIFRIASLSKPITAVAAMMLYGAME